ncbi:hypothetical protein GURASL_20610 [Geotalea uraniireducens]|uniref:Uncharacterized protein n=1 Tax=Geotalea uraniireducens TaxID=351604 RepID=A0ABN6VS59_9BACT|nr:hypothetical protein GURASL_20610 [Geotalea uraniireducens]
MLTVEKRNANDISISDFIASKSMHKTIKLHETGRSGGYIPDETLITITAAKVSIPDTIKTKRLTVRYLPKR